jgi:hypothetical protein
MHTAREKLMTCRRRRHWHQLSIVIENLIEGWVPVVQSSNARH